MASDLAPKPAPKHDKTSEAATPDGPTHAAQTRANKQRPTPEPLPPTSNTPNLDAAKEWDREQHVKAAMKMGATKEQARRHAREEVHED